MKIDKPVFTVQASAGLIDALLSAVIAFVGSTNFNHREKNSSVTSLRNNVTLAFLRAKIKDLKENRNEVYTMAQMSVGLLTGNIAITNADLWVVSQKASKLVGYKDIPSDQEMMDVLAFLLQDFCQANNFVTEDLIISEQLLFADRQNAENKKDEVPSTDKIDTADNTEVPVIEVPAKTKTRANTGASV